MIIDEPHTDTPRSFIAMATCDLNAVKVPYEFARQLERELEEAKVEIARMRAIPLPAEPHERDPAHRQWHVDVQHYESLLKEQE